MLSRFITPFFAVFLVLQAFPSWETAVVFAQETIDVPDWVVPWQGPKEIAAQVGDKIVFTWTGMHNVYIHPSMSCDLEGRIEIGLTSPTEYTVTEADAGTTIFFSCDIGAGAHCQAGQHMNVVVAGGADAGESIVTDPVATDAESAEGVATEEEQAPEGSDVADPVATDAESAEGVATEEEQAPEGSDVADPVATDAESAEGVATESEQAPEGSDVADPVATDAESAEGVATEEEQEDDSSSSNALPSIRYFFGLFLSVTIVCASVL